MIKIKEFYDTSSSQINLPPTYTRDTSLQEWDSFFPEENFDLNETRGQRVKEAMFPTLSQTQSPT